MARTGGNGGLRPPANPFNPWQSDPRPNTTYDNSTLVGNNGGQNLRNAIRGECKNPAFKRLDVSGRECAGSYINETQVLRFGDQGCAVLLLQQRLNSIESEVDILEPNGEFNCRTKAKLMRVMGAVQIALNQFQPDEQTGFDELRGGKQLTPYSYMDAENI